jgi:hypothetical protein
MRQIRQERLREAAEWIALALGLLLLVGMVHGVGWHHHSAADSAGLFLLVPIFLFGAVAPVLSLWVPDGLGETLVSAEPVRAALLFGRPPPSELF